MQVPKIALSISFLCFGIATAFAQQGTMATGGDQTGAGGSVSYSAGQIVYTTASSNGSVAQGVQQPYEISVVTGTADTTNEINLYSYPNPAIDYIDLMVADITSEKLTYTLFDAGGKLLSSGEISDAQIRISLLSYASGTYYLKVTSAEKELKQFKIIKNQPR